MPKMPAVAVAAGADALGFVMYRKSPRWVEPAVARSIIAGLPPFVLPVGVFVNEEAERVRALMDECGFALAQLHGDESALYCQNLGRPALKALRLKDRGTFLALAEFQGRANVRGFLIDAFSDQAYGGTGTDGRLDLGAGSGSLGTHHLGGRTARRLTWLRRFDRCVPMESMSAAGWSRVPARRIRIR